MSSNHKSRRIAEVTYQAIRSDAMTVFEMEINGTIQANVRLTHINDEALQVASAWRNDYGLAGRTEHEPNWDWNKQTRKFRRRPRRVELAIWSDDQLCGLVLGRISDRCVVATIHLIESNPNDHPLKSMVAPIATRYLEALGISINAHEISIDSPVPSLIEFYKGLGFKREIRKGKKVLQLKKTLLG